MCQALSSITYWVLWFGSVQTWNCLYPIDQVAWISATQRESCAELFERTYIRLRFWRNSRFRPGDTRCPYEKLTARASKHLCLIACLLLHHSGLQSNVYIPSWGGPIAFVFSNRPVVRIHKVAIIPPGERPRTKKILLIKLFLSQDFTAISLNGYTDHNLREICLALCLSRGFMIYKVIFHHINDQSITTTHCWIVLQIETEAEISKRVTHYVDIRAYSTGLHLKTSYDA